jgi:hypothetical protein
MWVEKKKTYLKSMVPEVNLWEVFFQTTNVPNCKLKSWISSIYKFLPVGNCYTLDLECPSKAHVFRGCCPAGSAIWRWWKL